MSEAMSVEEHRHITATRGTLKALIHIKPEGTRITVIDTTPRSRGDGLRSANQIELTPELLQSLRSFTYDIGEIIK